MRSSQAAVFKRTEVGWAMQVAIWHNTGRREVRGAGAGMGSLEGREEGAGDRWSRVRGARRYVGRTLSSYGDEGYLGGSGREGI